MQHVVSGLTYREVAECLDLTAEEVRLRLYRTLNRLGRECSRAIMDDGGGGVESYY